MSAVALEREIKLVAPDEFELPTMDGAVPGLLETDPVRLHLDATYYDTSDLALIRAGATLRYRVGESGPPWTVKLPDDATTTSLTRLEIRFEGPPGTVPTAARDLVRAYVRSRGLRPVARLHTERTNVSLIDAGGDRIAELVDDLVVGYCGEHETTVFREVELELIGTHRQRRLRRAAVERLAAAGCRREPPHPQLVRALGDRACRPADVTVTALVADPTVLEAIRHALGVSVARLIRHDAGVRIGDDPEDAHQLRVAARTLRSNLKTFGPVLDRAWAREMRSELSWLGSAAGGLRDLDVLEERLHRMSGGVGEDDAAALEALLRQLTEEKERARRVTLDALRCRRYDVLLEALVRATRYPSLRSHSSVDEPADVFLRRAARRQVDKLDEVVARVADPPSDSDLHDVRIQAKRTRYAIEAARPIIGAPATEHAAALAVLQDVLGEFHDSTVMAQWLRSAAAASPTFGFVAGQLLAAEHAEQHRLRDRVHHAWQTAAAPRLRHWL